jgi:hypothetical protein
MSSFLRSCKNTIKKWIPLLLVLLDVLALTVQNYSRRVKKKDKSEG